MRDSLVTLVHGQPSGMDITVSGSQFIGEFLLWGFKIREYSNNINALYLALAGYYI
jgi:hypothetical protein